MYVYIYIYIYIDRKIDRYGVKGVADLFLLRPDDVQVANNLYLT